MNAQSISLIVRLKNQLSTHLIQCRTKFTRKLMRSNTNWDHISPTSPHSRWWFFKMRLITTFFKTTTRWDSWAVQSSPPIRWWLIAKFFKCICTLFFRSNYFVCIVTKPTSHSGIEFLNWTIDAFMCVYFLHSKQKICNLYGMWN